MYEYLKNDEILNSSNRREFIYVNFFILHVTSRTRFSIPRPFGFPRILSKRGWARRDHWGGRSVESPAQSREHVPSFAGFQEVFPAAHLGVPIERSCCEACSWRHIEVAEDALASTDRVRRERARVRTPRSSEPAAESRVQRPVRIRK